MKKISIYLVFIFLVACSKSSEDSADTLSIVDSFFQSLNNKSYNVRQCETYWDGDSNVDYCGTIQLSFSRSEVNIIEISIFEEYDDEGIVDTDCESWNIYEVSEEEYNQRIQSNTFSEDFFKIVSSSSNSITLVDNYNDYLTIEILDNSRILLSGDVEQEGGYVMNTSERKICN